MQIVLHVLVDIHEMHERHQYMTVIVIIKLCSLRQEVSLKLVIVLIIIEVIDVICLHHIFIVINYQVMVLVGYDGVLVQMQHLVHGAMEVANMLLVMLHIMLSEAVSLDIRLILSIDDVKKLHLIDIN